MRIAFAILLCGSIGAAGCSRPQGPPPTVPASFVQSAASLPKVTETQEEIKAEMRKYPAFTPPFEEQRLKLLVLWEEIRKREGIEGFTAPPLQPSNNTAVYIDPQTMQLAWRAMACYNPDCPGKGKGGGPLLFARPNKTLSVGPDGKLVVAHGGDIPDPDKCHCPACGSGDFIASYDPPESIVRDRQLNDEMAAIYKACHEADAAGQPVKLPGRSGQEVMTNKAELPKLYIVPLSGQTVMEGEFLVPVSHGLDAAKRAK
ncbi:MAG: hypothetical protein K8T25_21685 [Planctomycetia bacterium]|nr:hypothetical protein [Planctomycetia bacterium]